MGKTYNKQSHKYDDDTSSRRSGNGVKHANGRKTGGMRTLNNYVDEYEDFDEDPFHDEIGFEEDITIQHIQNDKS
jgi:hypothetical protein